MNVGDEMQGLAGLQFLPHLDTFVERDALDDRLPLDLSSTFFNRSALRQTGERARHLVRDCRLPQPGTSVSRGHHQGVVSTRCSLPFMSSRGA